MMTPFPTPSSEPEAQDKAKASRRFRLACRMLREAGYLEEPLPGAKRGESPVDWLVRHGLASVPHVAAEMLICGRGLTALLDEIEALGGEVD